MKYLLSRFGGHSLIIGKGKASNQNLPEDQSFENILGSYAIEMKGFSYLSSYEMMPEFMGAYKKLPKNAIKIADIEHDLIEVFLQYDVSVNTSVYFSTTGYCNVFAIYLKTNFKDVEDMIGKIESSYDCVLIIRAIDMGAEVVKKTMPEILYITLITLIYEMGIKDSCCDVTPSKTSLGKKIDLKKLKEGIEKLKKIQIRKELAEIIEL
jgi:hypothetical protein